MEYVKIASFNALCNKNGCVLRVLLKDDPQKETECSDTYSNLFSGESAKFC